MPRQPGGARSGSSGKAFFNIEGAALGNFSSYGIARFNIAALKQSFDIGFGSGGWKLELVTVSLTQSNAAFSAAGEVGIRHTGDDTSSIQPGAGTFAYPVTGDFTDLGNLVDYTFTPVATGTAEHYTLFQAGGSNGAGASQLAADVLADNIVTLVFVDLSSAVAATYAGATNFTLSGPTLGLSVSAVPVPAALPLLVSALGLLAARRRGARAAGRALGRAV